MGPVPAFLGIKRQLLSSSSCIALSFSSVTDSCLTIWVADERPPLGEQVVLWNGYEEPEGATCLLKIVDDQAVELRSRYLQWVSDLGELKLRGRTLIDWLKIDPGFSYWWMTRVAESNYLASRSFLDVMRVMALEDLLRDNLPNKVRLVGANKLVSETISELCLLLGIEFESKHSPKAQLFSLDGWIRGKWLKSLRALAIVGLWAFRTWPARRKPDRDCLSSENTILLCTYNIAVLGEDNMDTRAYERYWGGLPNLLNEQGMNISWLHNMHVLRNRKMSTAIDNLNSMDTSTHAKQNHVVLQTWLSISVIWISLIRWIKLVYISYRIGNIRNRLTRSNQNWLWPVMSNDWNESIFGITAISNLINFELFDRALGTIPKHERGLVLYENQPWEQAFTHAWRKHGHGELIGVAHAMIRFWDVRYFLYLYSPVCFERLKSSVDYLAVNGPNAFKNCIEAGIPEDRLLEVEALRFEHLEQPQTQTLIKSKTSSENTFDLLVLGDYDEGTTLYLMAILSEAVKSIGFSLNIVFRGHPNFSIDPDEYPDLRIVCARYSLEEERQKFDATFSANSTSASLERHLSGMPTLVMDDPTGLNFSPMTDVSSCKFIRSATELVLALQTLHRGDEETLVAQVSDFFWLDPTMSRWRNALELST